MCTLLWSLRLSRWMSQASTPVISLTSTSFAVHSSFICCTYLFLSSCTYNFPPNRIACSNDNWHLITLSNVVFYQKLHSGPSSCASLDCTHLKMYDNKFISNISMLHEILSFSSKASCLEHLAHNRGVPCTDDLPRRQMLLLNSLLSVRSPLVLPQVVQHRPFWNGKCCKCCSLTASCPPQSLHFNLFCPHSPCLLFSLNLILIL